MLNRKLDHGTEAKRINDLVAFDYYYCYASSEVIHSQLLVLQTKLGQTLTDQIPTLRIQHHAKPS
jgi:hypothetical protein